MKAGKGSPLPLAQLNNHCLLVGYSLLVPTASCIIIIHKLAKLNMHPRTPHIPHLHSLLILSTLNVALQPTPPTQFLQVIHHITSPAHRMQQRSHALMTQIRRLLPLATHNMAPLVTRHMVLFSGPDSMVRVFLVRAAAFTTSSTTQPLATLYLTVDQGPTPIYLLPRLRDLLLQLLKVKLSLLYLYSTASL